MSYEEFLKYCEAYGDLAPHVEYRPSNSTLWWFNTVDSPWELLLLIKRIAILNGVTIESVITMNYSTKITEALARMEGTNDHSS